MRILVRTSLWAIWARRFGSFALPLVVLPVLMHRAGAIPSETFEIAEGVGLVLAAIAILASFVALARIWVTGDRGWGRALGGLVLGVVCLAPLGLWVADFVRYPAATDISTDPADPPALLANIAYVPPSPAQQQLLAAAFPTLQSRNYPLPTGQVFGLVDALVTEHGWDVTLRREPPTPADDGQINAVATTLLGFRDEVSIRIRLGNQQTVVAMRSTALSPREEAGANAARVEDFLTTLDARISQLMNGTPADEASDSDSETPPTPVVPAPLPRGKRR